MRDLKQALNHGYVLKRIPGNQTKFNRKTWLKSYICTKTQLRWKAKIKLENVFFRLMNNSVFGKTNNSVGKHW